MEAKFGPLEKRIKKPDINGGKIFQKNTRVLPYWPTKEWRNFGRVQSITGWWENKVTPFDKKEQQQGAKSNVEFNVNKNPTDATVCRYLFTAKLLYIFRVSQHPSSGVLKTVIAASGTGHNTGAATSLQRGPFGPRWREVAAPVLWPVPEAAITVFSTPDDGCCDTRNM